MSEVKVKIKKLVEEAVVPMYAHDGDAGFDFTATSVKYDEKYDRWMYGTGLSMEIPYGYYLAIVPRSSNTKTDAYIPNTPGTIDCIYRGEIFIAFKNRDTQNKQQPYNVGDRVAQGILKKYETAAFEVVDELSETERGEGGFGSTGK